MSLSRAFLKRGKPNLPAMSLSPSCPKKVPNILLTNTFSPCPNRMGRSQGGQHTLHSTLTEGGSLPSQHGQKRGGWNQEQTRELASGLRLSFKLERKVQPLPRGIEADGQLVSLGDGRRTPAQLGPKGMKRVQRTSSSDSIFFPSIWRFIHLPDLPLRVWRALVSHGELSTKGTM